MLITIKKGKTRLSSNAIPSGLFLTKQYLKAVSILQSQHLDLNVDYGETSAEQGNQPRAKQTNKSAQNKQEETKMQRVMIVQLIFISISITINSDKIKY